MNTEGAQLRSLFIENIKLEKENLCFSFHMIFFFYSIRGWQKYCTFFMKLLTVEDKAQFSFSYALAFDIN